MACEVLFSYVLYKLKQPQKILRWKIPNYVRKSLS